MVVKFINPKLGLVINIQNNNNNNNNNFLLCKSFLSCYSPKPHLFYFSRSACHHHFLLLITPDKGWFRCGGISRKTLRRLPAIAKAMRANGIKDPLHITVFVSLNVLPKLNHEALDFIGIQVVKHSCEKVYLGVSQNLFRFFL